MDAPPGAGSTVLALQSVEDGRYGETLDGVWEIEPGRRILPVGSLPELAAGRFDPPQRLAAFLDAVRWSAVTSVDTTLLQAPFRSGVAIEDYQLEPVARAVEAPAVNLLLADDVGLGKTIEAGLVAQELLLRHRVRRIMVVWPAGLTVKWRDELADKFGLEFIVVDSAQCATLRRTHGWAANPFHMYPLTIVSLAWLRGARAQRLLDEVLPPDGPSDPPTFDLLILDEAHHVAPAAPKQEFAVDSQQTKLMRRLAPHFAHRLFLSATPHNGYRSSFTALLEIIDPLRLEFAGLRRKRLQARRGSRATDLVTLVLKKRLFSSPAAFGHTVAVYTETLRSRRGGDMDSLRFDEDEWYDEFFDEAAALDDEQQATAEDDALAVSSRITPPGQEDELAVLGLMDSWARAHEGRPDAKAEQLPALQG